MKVKPRKREQDLDSGTKILMHTHTQNPNQFQKAHFDIIAKLLSVRQQRAVAYIPISIPCPEIEPG